ncbi:MAG: type I 3-dehydroquinate dehydratase [Lachnospiraceae bacterium]|nr:type I 3-dehydroquinate dehydratase [Lachnospiraceae bacterium]
MKTFAKQTGPVLAGVVRERTMKDVLAQIRNYEVHGANAIDLHLSSLNDELKNVESIKKIVNATKLPILSMNYNMNYDLGGYVTDEEERVGLMLKAVEAGTAAIDIQGYTFDYFSHTNFRKEYDHLGYSFIKGNPREVVVDEIIIQKQMDLIDRVHTMGAEVLLSCHPRIPMNTEQVVDLALFLEKRKPDVIKIVTMCTNEEELAEAFKTMITLKKEVKTNVSFHCAGQAGRLTRVMNPVLGGYIAFCVDKYGINTDVEQLNLGIARDMIDKLNRIK